MTAPGASLRYFGDPCLRGRAREADPAAAETGRLLASLWRALDRRDGVGLAAPQLGADLRLLVVKEPRDRGRTRRVGMINPVIRETFGPRIPFEEGCLSFPGLYTTVHRPRGIVVEFDDPERPGERRSLRDDGLLARIVQHEVDHLDGVLFIDHLSPLRRLLLAPRLASIVIRGRLRR